MIEHIQSKSLNGFKPFFAAQHCSAPNKHSARPPTTSPHPSHPPPPYEPRLGNRCLAAFAPLFVIGNPTRKQKKPDIRHVCAHFHKFRLASVPPPIPLPHHTDTSHRLCGPSLPPPLAGPPGRPGPEAIRNMSVGERALLKCPAETAQGPPPSERLSSRNIKNTRRRQHLFG